MYVLVNTLKVNGSPFLCFCLTFALIFMLAQTRAQLDNRRYLLYHCQGRARYWKDEGVPVRLAAATLISTPYSRSCRLKVAESKDTLMR